MPFRLDGWMDAWCVDVRQLRKGPIRVKRLHSFEKERTGKLVDKFPLNPATLDPVPTYLARPHPPPSSPSFFFPSGRRLTAWRWAVLVAVCVAAAALPEGAHAGRAGPEPVRAAALAHAAGRGHQAQVPLPGQRSVSQALTWRAPPSSFFFSSCSFARSRRVLTDCLLLSLCVCAVQACKTRSRRTRTWRGSSRT